MVNYLQWKETNTRKKLADRVIGCIAERSEDSNRWRYHSEWNCLRTTGGKIGGPDAVGGNRREVKTLRRRTDKRQHRDGWRLVRSIFKIGWTSPALKRWSRPWKPRRCSISADMKRHRKPERIIFRVTAVRDDGGRRLTLRSALFLFRVIFGRAGFSRTYGMHTHGTESTKKETRHSSRMLRRK